MTTSYLSSFNGLFLLHEGGKTLIERIEIPINQRDYAQGRSSDDVGRIRADFLDALYDALVADKPVSLDFVYGDMEDGTLKPLDGQQRLTTLFLLHWYLAWRADRLDQEEGWKQFTYATRASARSFCRLLTTSKPTAGWGLRDWFTDQSWFQYTWHYDPTIQSMLVMLEAIHACFGKVDHEAAWNKLMDKESPAISFHILPNAQMGLSEDTYIKMNSRGKPLTPFENFKAYFEKLLDENGRARADEFARKMDVEWTDVFWKMLVPSKYVVDEELLNYWEYVTRLCAWNNGVQPDSDHRRLATAIYGRDNVNAAANLDFLIRCFDTWHAEDIGQDIGRYFDNFFLLQPMPIDSDDTSRVVLYAGNAGGTNLLLACCKEGAKSSMAQVLLLYAVLLHRLHRHGDFSRRMRILRNLIQSSENNLRTEDMPRFVKDVEMLIVEGNLNEIHAFNQAQVQEEKLKLDHLAGPELERALFHLEDHQFLRGALGAFEIETTGFCDRARAFHLVFDAPTQLPKLTAALLAAGDYGQRISRRFLRFGSKKFHAWWRTGVLSGINRSGLAKIRHALGQVLDAVAASNDVDAALLGFTNRFLEMASETGRDWRWYLVKYELMRDGDSGFYAYTGSEPGFDLCMLDNSSMRGYFRDPYLTAIFGMAGVSTNRVDGDIKGWGLNGPWFSGYETEPRRVRFEQSGIEMQCHKAGFELFVPEDIESKHQLAFSQVCQTFGVDPDGVFRVQQMEVANKLFDLEDRIVLGANLLKALIEAGL